VRRKDHPQDASTAFIFIKCYEPFTEQFFSLNDILINLIKLVGISIGGFLMLATILIISNTIKLTIYSRKEEIEIMKLVGATNFFIQVPFFLEGLIQGLAGSLLALGILYISYKIFIVKVISDYSLYLGASNLVFLPQNLVIALICFGILLGIVGCALSMGRFLKV